MGKISFNDLDAAVAATSSNEGSGSDIGFFTLKNDGDEAVVRFMCDSVDDFDIQMVHNITLRNKYRKVACLRDPRDPIGNCPMCAAGIPLTTRFFIRLISYNKVADPQTGNVIIVPKAMIWERETRYAKTLKSYLDNYGPLSDVICKIIRHGAAGDMNTKYEIVPNLSKQIYRDDIYVKDPSLFGTFETIGSIVMKKDYNEMTTFIATGSFPEKPKESTTTSTQAPAQPAAQAAPTYTAAPAYVPTTSTPMSAEPAYVALQIDPMTHVAPAATQAFDPTRVTPRAGFGSSEQPAQQGFERPRRY